MFGKKNNLSSLGEGSMIVLPIAETQFGNFSIYIPTNVIFITDR